MKEKLDLLPLKLKGHVKVEMFDKEGKLLHKHEGDNYISHGVNALLRRVQLSWLTAGLPHNQNKQYGALDNDGTVHFAKYLVLTDNDAATDASADAMLQGDVIGWCATTEQSYSDPKSGLLNVAESYADLNKIHLVFDFATDRANGTFRSAYLSEYNIPMQAKELPLTPVAKLARAYNYSYLCYADSYLWTHIDSTVYKIDPETGEEIASYNVEENIIGMCVHDDYIYYTRPSGSSNYYLRKYEISTGSKTSILLSGGYPIIASDGDYIYVAGGSSIRKISIATFSITETKSFSNSVSILFCRDGVLYGYASDGKGYIIDFDAGTMTPTSYVSMDRQIAYDGVNDYILDNYKTVYKRQGSYNEETNCMLCTTSLFSKSAISIFSRYRFPSNVTKDDTKTMKITYDVEFS